MKSPPKQPKASTGPSQHLISRINHLRDLLHNLPESIPLNPSNSTYDFALSPDDIEERGTFGAVSHSLEIGLGQRLDGAIHFQERGYRLEGLISMLKEGVKKMNDVDRTAFESAWLERLIRAAEADGAKHSKRKTLDLGMTGVKEPTSKRRRVIVIDEEEDNKQNSPSVSPLPSASSSSSDSKAPRLTKQLPSNLKQTTLPFTKDTRTEEEKAAARKKEKQEIEARFVDFQEKARVAEEKRKTQEREMGRKRQQKHREKVKAEREAEDNLEDVNAVLMKSAEEVKQVDFALDHHEMAEASRPQFKTWREERNGTQGGAVQGRAERTNWFHQYLWPSIHNAMVKASWSSEGAVKILKRDLPQLYGHIHCGTINRWKEPGERRWSDKTLQNVTRHHAILSSGRTGALAKFPELTEEIKSSLIALRRSGMVVNVPIARSLMLAIIKEKYPQVLSPHFQCTERYVRDFLQSVMSWTPRAGTRAAAHLPDNAEELCERTFMRIAYAMRWYNIPPKLVINGDQMGIYVLPSCSQTFHAKGDRQVDIVGKDEKRASTVFVTSTPCGDILPFQLIWGGRTIKSVPDTDADGMDEAVKFGFDFTYARSESSPKSHFSTLKTMKEYLANIIQPYIKRIIEEDGLEEDQMAILFIDAYPVHTGKDFRALISRDYPNIILFFVPANCTGKFQPADIGLQRPIKHFLKQKLFEWMAETHREKIAQGAEPEDIKVSTSLPVLRNASVRPLVEVYKYLSNDHGRSLIKKAWKNCVAKNYNLSEDCLTSGKTQTDVRNYLKQDKTLRDEIEDRCGVVYGLDDNPTSDPVEVNLDLRIDDNDDGDVPLGEVISATFGESSGTGFQTTEDGTLENAGEGENVWAYDKEGNLYSQTGELPQQEE
ncbi:hypothetical protein K435DRAFT_747854 [Dendrothele bispora CBS 962.96]|uniref:DDE-1 domain-containing protein n=1 Tax=Dendrothele bispora (strain CBS 962.96) TaxID=1314807 RepID=A0A4V4HHP3_DENBC|nr:hypothetical protein K435DRAFT_747854 [Dendrothele bispora CBS 962.96]